MRRRAYPVRGLRDGEGLRPIQAIQTYQYIEAIFIWERWWGISWSVFFDYLPPAFQKCNMDAGS